MLWPKRVFRLSPSNEHYVTFLIISQSFYMFRSRVSRRVEPRIVAVKLDFPVYSQRSWSTREILCPSNNACRKEWRLRWKQSTLITSLLMNPWGPNAGFLTWELLIALKIPWYYWNKSWNSPIHWPTLLIFILFPFDGTELQLRSWMPGQLLLCFWRAVCSET